MLNSSVARAYNHGTRMFRSSISSILLSYLISDLFGAYDDAPTTPCTTTDKAGAWHAPCPGDGVDSSHTVVDAGSLHQCSAQHETLSAKTTAPEAIDKEAQDLAEDPSRHYTKGLLIESNTGKDIQLSASITRTISDLKQLSRNKIWHESLFLELEKQDDQLSNTVNTTIRNLEIELKNELKNNNLESAPRHNNFGAPSILSDNIHPNGQSTALSNTPQGKEGSRGSEDKQKVKFHNYLRQQLEKSVQTANSETWRSLTNNWQQNAARIDLDELDHLLTLTIRTENTLVEGVFNVIRQSVNSYIIKRTQFLLLKNQNFNMMIQKFLHSLICLKDIYNSEFSDDILKSAAMRAFYLLAQDLSVDIRDLLVTNYETYMRSITDRLELDIIQGVSKLVKKQQITPKLMRTVNTLRRTVECFIQYFKRTIKGIEPEMPQHAKVDEIIGELTTVAARHISNLLRELGPDITGRNPSSAEKSEKLQQRKLLCTSQLINALGLQFQLHNTLDCVSLTYDPAIYSQDIVCSSDTCNYPTKKAQNFIYADIETSKQQMNMHMESLQRMQKIYSDINVPKELIDAQAGSDEKIEDTSSNRVNNKLKETLQEIARFREKVQVNVLGSLHAQVLNWLCSEKPEMTNYMWSRLRSVLTKYERNAFNKDIYAFLPTLYSYIEYFILEDHSKM